jgi:FtsZ-binding cell division protein ZapB
VTRSRLTEERALSSRQLMLVHSKMLRWLARPLLPKGWTAGGFKTSGAVEAQRASLQTLGNGLSVLGIFSFLCKSVSSATLYFARDLFSTSGNFEAIMFLTTTLTVQAIPSAMTLLLLNRFHFSGGGNGRGILMKSLLPHGDAMVALSSDSTDAAASNEQLASENTRLKAELKESSEQTRRLREEIERLKAGHSQHQSDISRLQMESLERARRLQEENQRLRAAVTSLQLHHA